MFSVCYLYMPERDANQNFPHVLLRLIQVKVFDTKKNWSSYKSRGRSLDFVFVEAVEWTDGRNEERKVCKLQFM